MGGMGSSRWGNGTTKKHTGNHAQVDIRQLKRDGFLECIGYKQLTWTDQNRKQSSINIFITDERIKFNYRFLHSIWREQWSEVSAEARFEYTPANYGGKRIWFSCPGCYSRCAILYVGHRVACRKCLNLAYQCQNETHRDRTVRSANKAADNLGLKNMLAYPPSRRKGMHKKTYERLKWEYERAQLIALCGLRV